LENEFFFRVDKQLLADIQADLEHVAARAALQAASGIEDRLLLDELVRLKVTPLNLSAVSFMPVVLVAWADGRVDAKERDSILRVAKLDGSTDASRVMNLLDTWLAEKPSPEFASNWWHFVEDASRSLTPESRNTWLNHLIGQVRIVAKASGGFLGIASISAEEHRIIEALERLLTNTTMKMNCSSL
jgi:hypothetical protein